MTKEKEQLLKRAKEYEKMLKNVDVSAKERKQQILIKIQKLDQRINELQKDAGQFACAEEVVECVFKKMGNMFVKKMEENARFFPELQYFVDGDLFIRKYFVETCYDENSAWDEHYHKDYMIDKDYVLDVLDKVSGNIIEAFDTAAHWQTPKQEQRVKKINKARRALKCATSEKDKLEKELKHRGLGKDAKQNLREELAVREKSIAQGMSIFQ